MAEAVEQQAPEEAPQQEQQAPSDELVKERLQELLKTADLSTTTEKQLRKKLEEELACDLTNRKLLIRQQVELFLAQQAPETEASAQPDEQVEEGGEEEEEEEEEEKPQKPARKRKSGFTATCVLSPALQEFLGVETMSRPQIVKAIWAYIKENNLQNPANRTQIIVDEKLGKIFKPPITQFSMNKQLSLHCRSKGDVVGTDNAEANGGDGDEEEEEKPKKKPAKRAKKNNEGGEGGRKAGGFQAPVEISAELAEFLGSDEPVSRPALVKKFWDYFKSNNLQDPSNKSMIKSDERLQKLLGIKSFKGMGLMKYLNKHIVKKV